MEHGPARRPALPTVSLAAVGAAAVSLAVVAVPWLRMSFEAPGLRVALETGGSLLAVTTVALLVRQCGLRSRADHLWLTLGLVVLAATSLGVAGLIVARRMVARSKRATPWAAISRARVLLAIAAFAPTGRVTSTGAAHPAARSSARRVAVFAAASLFAGCRPRRRPRSCSGRDRGDPRRSPPSASRAAPVAATSRCCAGSPSPSCSPASRSSTTRSSRRSAPRTCTSATCCGSPPGSRCFVGVARGAAGPHARPLRGRRRARAPPPRPRAARRRRAGARVHPPPRRPPERDARTGSRSSTPPTARWRTRGARSRRSSRPPTSRSTSRWSASARAWRPSAGSRCRSTCAPPSNVGDEVRAELVRIISEAVRNAAHHGGARHVRVELDGHAAGRADHRRRQRLPRRRQQRPRRRRLRPDRHARACRARRRASSAWNPSAAPVPSCRWCCHRARASTGRR